MVVLNMIQTNFFFISRQLVISKDKRNFFFSQKYFITVKAIATTGTVSVSSDGVTVLDNTKILSEVSVSDGTKCTGML